MGQNASRGHKSVRDIQDSCGVVGVKVGESVSNMGGDIDSFLVDVVLEIDVLVMKTGPPI